MNSLKVHYEDKISQLHQKIKETEVERDKILTNIGKIHIIISLAIQPSNVTSDIGFFFL